MSLRGPRPAGSKASVQSTSASSSMTPSPGASTTLTAGMSIFTPDTSVTSPPPASSSTMTTPYSPYSAVTTATVLASQQSQMTPVSASRTRNSSIYGKWEPLSCIIYGVVSYPFNIAQQSQSLARSASSRRPVTRVNGAVARKPVPGAGSEDQSHLAPLTEDDVGEREGRDWSEFQGVEVGDEVYAFERYVKNEGSHVWYRGYVARYPTVPPLATSASLLGGQPTRTVPTGVLDNPEVFVSLFPASIIHVRDQLNDYDEGKLADAYRSLRAGMDAPGGSIPGLTGRPMETLKEEDESVDGSVVTPGDKKAFRASVSSRFTNHAPNGTLIRTNHPSAIPHPASSVEKPPRPLPSFKIQDDTSSGAEQPLVDEIAAALREWHALLYVYLSRRDYRLFQIVQGHIEALHLGRRQLLANTLGMEETINLRRECVARLVKGNVVQGLDVIVRHPAWGGLVTVDVEDDVDARSWMSAVRMYAMQASLAYTDASPGGGPLYNFRGSALTNLKALTAAANSPLPSALFSPPPMSLHGRQGSEEILSPTARYLESKGKPQTGAKFYHVFLELRAFVASICAPGETVELYFSLYDKSANPPRFLTEEFCTVLNHRGVAAREWNEQGTMGRMRTLFTELGEHDVQEAIYLVCRIIRSGSLKAGQEASSSGASGRRGSSDLSSMLAPTRGDDTAAQSQTGTNSVGGRAVTPFGLRTAESQPTYFRRPFGCAVLELSQLTKMSADKSDTSNLREHVMPIFVPANEGAFTTLHQEIIGSRTKEFDKSPRAERLGVNIKVFFGDAKTIIRENPSLLHETPITYRLGFPDVVFPSDVRNDVYIKLWSGEFISGGLTTATGVSALRQSISRGASGNIQVTIEVRTAAGATVEGSISKGAGEPPMTYFHSLVFHKNNSPTFGELLKLQLPPDLLQSCHLFFTFRNRRVPDRISTTINTATRSTSTDVADRPFAFGFLPLFPDGKAFVKDGEHVLVLYKAEKLQQIMAPDYLDGPWSCADRTKLEQIVVPPNLAKSATMTRDSLIIRSYLCSTRFTQNSVLLELLAWEQLSSAQQILAVLSKFTFGGEGEIVKFLRDIFDSLFAILVSPHNQHGDLDDAVFNSLVTVLGIIQDRRFTNFQPVLEVYIDEHFSCAPASSHLIHSMNRLLANPAGAETATKLRSAFKVWHYLFQFVMRARALQKSKEVGMGATAEHLETQFKKELRQHLAEINRLMSLSVPASIGTQTFALQNFTSILPDLAETFSSTELVGIATGFANSIVASRGPNVIWKLLMYLQLVQGFLFDDPLSRTPLIESVVSWVKPHFGKYDEYVHVQAGESENAKDKARIQWLEGTRLCVTIMAIMLDKIDTSLVDPAVRADRKAYREEQDNVEYMLPLLPKILESYRELQSTASRQTIARSKSVIATGSLAPVVFPASYPFALVASSPAASQGSGYKSPIIGADFSTFFNSTLAETAIVLLVLILSASPKYLLGFFEFLLEVEGNENFSRFLSQFFKVAISILSNEAFPSTWLNVNILAHKVILKIAAPISDVLIRQYIPDQNMTYQFNSTMWQDALLMLFKLMSSPQLLIEDFSPQKRRAVWRLAGDLRVEGAAIITRMWDALGWPEQVSAANGVIGRFGGYQVALAGLVDQVLGLCLSHHDELRNAAVEILYSMIVSAFRLEGHFNAIENELINTLDKLFMSDVKGDQIARDFFIGHLRSLFEASNIDEALRERVSDFLESVDLFLELLLNVRELPDGDEYQDDRVIATLRLMNFIRRIGRDEIYIKYVHQLVNMHLQSQNFVEAALTLKLHADLYDWDMTSIVDPMEELNLPRQSHFERKEMLSLLVLDYLGKGKAWEIGVEICKELATQHGEVTFNYQKLSEILMHQATLLDRIVNDQRYYPEYFRVGFYGNFPAALQNKQFIYRGYEWEKFGAFCERMLNKHPVAQLLKPNVTPNEEIMYGSEQFIQCAVVVPEPDRSHVVFLNPDVPAAVRNYYEHSEINLFSSSRPFSKEGASSVSSEFRDRDIWVEKTYFRTEAAFPTVLRRSEIVDSNVEEISPIEVALNDVLQKTKELTNLEVRYNNMSRTEQPISTNALSMSLNSAVDSPVNGGVGLYRQAFLGADYLPLHPENAALVQRLRDAIDEQVRVIARCLQLHGRLCPYEMQPFHQTLEKFFRKNFYEEIQRLPAVTTAELNGVGTHAGELFSPATEVFDGMSDITSLGPDTRKRSMSSSQAISLPPIQPVSHIPLNASMYSRSSASMDAHRPEDLSVVTMTLTPLQRQIAHLSRNGIQGLSAGPNDRQSEEPSSPNASTVNVVEPSLPVPATRTSSVPSLNSLKKSTSRLSRLGPLSWGRK
ncbi:hypothetical protein DACRYDRAFT_105054 [Dacryopinax primogenitus]|uniref:Cytoplasmic protein n=1 Tax=Dacryopinax primogenitus (strain DJM 731) TaxID=1858805 RepID=M5G166_DACPD|nr:uncharacterized protein DACRYDRAFT_105054 [Dacryopinax primogenitus]EJU03981.1 hypothetical protein DACRYDRAFT_105054 [Dacryopinax primogenitus]